MQSNRDINKFGRGGSSPSSEITKLFIPFLYKFVGDFGNEFRIVGEECLKSLHDKGRGKNRLGWDFVCDCTKNPDPSRVRCDLVDKAEKINCRSPRIFVRRPDDPLKKLGQTLCLVCFRPDIHSGISGTYAGIS